MIPSSTHSIPRNYHTAYECWMEPRACVHANFPGMAANKKKDSAQVLSINERETMFTHLGMPIDEHVKKHVHSPPPPPPSFTTSSSHAPTHPHQPHQRMQCNYTASTSFMCRDNREKTNISQQIDRHKSMHRNIREKHRKKKNVGIGRYPRTIPNLRLYKDTIRTSELQCSRTQCSHQLESLPNDTILNTTMIMRQQRIYPNKSRAQTQ